jgi:hypothetical protein
LHRPIELAQGPNIGTYDDVDRVERGTYRLRAADS